MIRSSEIFFGCSFIRQLTFEIVITYWLCDFGMDCVREMPALISKQNERWKFTSKQIRGRNRRAKIDCDKREHDSLARLWDTHTHYNQHSFANLSAKHVRKTVSFYANAFSQHFFLNSHGKIDGIATNWNAIIKTIVTKNNRRWRKKHTFNHITPFFQHDKLYERYNNNNCNINVYI